MPWPLHIGVAGWANPPRERARRVSAASHLQHYAMHFNAVEINSSFHRSHRQSTYAEWNAATPATFRFAVKLPRTITHDSGLRHCRAEWHQFLDQTSGLGGKLAVVLVQLPPSLAYEARVAARFFAMLASECPGRIACEPRHDSWFEPGAERMFRRLAIARVAADPARYPAAAHPGGTSELVYHRLHGSPRMYYSAYGRAFVRDFGQKLAALRPVPRDGWVIFDNTAQGAAWPDAQALQRQFRPLRPRSPLRRGPAKAAAPHSPAR